MQYFSLDKSQYEEHVAELNKIYIMPKEMEKLFIIVPVSIFLLLTHLGVVIDVLIYLWWFVNAREKTKQSVFGDIELMRKSNPKLIERIERNKRLDSGDSVRAIDFLAEYVDIMESARKLKFRLELSELDLQVIECPYFNMLDPAKKALDECLGDIKAVNTVTIPKDGAFKYRIKSDEMYESNGTAMSSYSRKLQQILEDLGIDFEEANK